MTIPQVGVTGVIQDPGLGGVLAKGIGGITQLLMQQQQMRDKQARDAADIAYQNELVTASRENRAMTKQQYEEQQRLMKQQEERSAAAIQELANVGGITHGVAAGLMLLPPAERAKKLTEYLMPQKLADNDRLVAPGANGQFSTVVGPDQTIKAADNSADYRNWLAGEINPQTGRAYDPNTAPSQLPPEQAKQWKVFQQSLESVRAPKGTSMSVQAGSSFAQGLGKAAGDVVAEGAVKARSARVDLNTIAELRKLLGEGGVLTGFGSENLTQIGSALAQLGIGGSGIADPVARTQAYAAIVGQRVGEVIKLFGSGTGLSDADREYAQQIAGGNLKMTPQALKRILDMGERADRFLIDTHNQAVDALPDDETPASVKRTLRVDAPPAAPTAPAASGKTYQYKGKSFPIIIGSDGKSYISTPDGTFKVGG